MGGFLDSIARFDCDYIRSAFKFVANYIQVGLLKVQGFIESTFGDLLHNVEETFPFRKNVTYTGIPYLRVG
jgi:hypothetical protein